MTRLTQPGPRKKLSPYFGGFETKYEVSLKPTLPGVKTVLVDSVSPEQTFHHGPAHIRQAFISPLVKGRQSSVIEAH